MKIQDLNDPTKSMVGGEDLTIWAIMFGILIVFVVVLAYTNRNSE